MDALAFAGVEEGIDWAGRALSTVEDWPFRRALHAFVDVHVIDLVGGAREAGSGAQVEVVGEIAIYASGGTLIGLILGAGADHVDWVIDLTIPAEFTLVDLGVVNLVEGADGAVIAVKVRVGGRAVLALFGLDVVDLLEGAGLAGHRTIVPVLRVRALYAFLAVPVLAAGLVAHAFGQVVVVDSAIRAVEASVIEAVLALRAE